MSALSPPLPREKCIEALEKMYLTRFADEKMQKLVRQDKGGTFHLESKGHELIGVVSALALEPGKDWAFPYYRDRALAIGLGCDLQELFGAFLARDVPHHSGGRMMPEHFSHKRLRLPCQSSVVGSQFLHAVGVAKSAALHGTDEVVYVSAGEGATSQGDFHEALNYACLHKLSVLFVIQNNGWAISVPVDKQTAGGNPALFGRGYEGLVTYDIDGTAYSETASALAQAVKRGRNREGPSLIVARIPRMGSHSSSDDPQKYQSQATLLQAQRQDPLPAYESWLLENTLVTPQQIQDLQLRTKQIVEKAAKAGESYPFPDRKTASERLFAKTTPSKTAAFSPINSDPIVIMDAINHALDEEMAQNPHVVLFGQDIAHGKGGVFGITRHLTDKYGEERCFNTPLAESTIVGTAIGMSFYGKIPVIEIQFADYMWTGMNQIVNELSSMYYRSNGEWNCPIVIRMPYGGYIQGGPYHSQSVEAFLCHCPGLKVVIPSHAADAKMLLKAAIRDPNPVIFLEHKALYRQRVFCARPEPKSTCVANLEKSAVIHEGEMLTVVTFGMATVMAADVAKKLAAEGISIEVIDLRTLTPLDFDTILTSIKKTGRCLVCHEAPLHCGFGAEVAARCAEQAFTYLDAPIKRIGAKSCPVPYCKQLEEAILPSKADIETAVRELVQY